MKRDSSEIEYDFINKGVNDCLLKNNNMITSFTRWSVTVTNIGNRISVLGT